MTVASIELLETVADTDADAEENESIEALLLMNGNDENEEADRQ